MSDWGRRRSGSLVALHHPLGPVGILFWRVFGSLRAVDPESSSPVSSLSPVLLEVRDGSLGDPCLKA